MICTLINYTLVLRLKARLEFLHFVKTQTLCRLAFIAAFFCPNVYADTSYYLFGISQHFGSNTYLNTKDLISDRTEYNWYHKTFVIEHKDILVGYFNNSYDDDVYLLAKPLYKTRLDKRLTARLLGGVSYGYRKCLKRPDLPRMWLDKKLCPAIIPEIEYNRGRYSISVGAYGSALITMIKLNL